MKCTRCNDAPALKHSELCGCCDIAVHQRCMTELPAAVPEHFNLGLGEHIEGRDHLKRRREELKREGVIDNWD